MRYITIKRVVFKETININYIQLRGGNKNI